AVRLVERAQVAVQLGIARPDRLEVGGVQLSGRELLPLEQAEALLGGQPQRVDHPRTAAPIPAQPPPGEREAPLRTACQDPAYVSVPDTWQRCAGSAAASLRLFVAAT